MSSPKYNRTLHLPWSPGKGSDDKVATNVESLIGRLIVITEKLDGSNTSLEKDGCFARTHSGPPTHVSFDGLKAFHSAVKYLIPEGTQIFGEWCYAKHSIAYNALPGHFLMFAKRDGDFWAPWGEVHETAQEFGLPTVPVLWIGELESEQQLKKLTIELASKPSVCGGEREGVVVRNSDQFRNKDFSKNVMKYVRANHVQTNEHWKDQEIIRNTLATGAK